MHRKRAVAAIAWLMLVALAQAARAGTIYSLRDLGTIGASATAINGSGQMAGYAAMPDGSMLPALFGNQTTILPGGQGQAAGINNGGTIVGTTWGQGTAQATEWVNGQATPLSGLGGASSYGMAINNNNQAAGSAQLGNGQSHAVVWSSDGVHDLGTLGGGWSAAYAINDNGQVTGASETTGGSFEAFSTSANGIRSLGTLGGRSSQGFAVSDTGEIAGAAQTASGYYHAFTSSGMSLVDLGTLGGTQSYAYGLNNLGDVVGYSYTAQGERHAFLYSNGVMVDLNALLPLLEGWTITDAFAINDAGLIAGSALVDGVDHAFELTPDYSGSPVAPTPEPLSTLGVGLALVVGGMFYRRRYHRNANRRDERLG